MTPTAIDADAAFQSVWKTIGTTTRPPAAL